MKRKLSMGALILPLFFLAFNLFAPDTNTTSNVESSHSLVQTNATPPSDSNPVIADKDMTGKTFGFSNLVEEVRNARDRDNQNIDPGKSTIFILSGAILFTLSCLIVLGILKKRYSRF